MYALRIRSNASAAQANIINSDKSVCPFNTPMIPMYMYLHLCSRLGFFCTFVTIRYIYFRKIVYFKFKIFQQFKMALLAPASSSGSECFCRILQGLVCLPSRYKYHKKSVNFYFFKKKCRC